MNQPITTDSQKKEFLESFLIIDEYQSGFISKADTSYHFMAFAPFCHAYAGHLLNTSSFNSYGVFIKKFNELIENDEFYLFCKEQQTRQSIAIGGLAFLKTTYNNALIDDKRPEIDNATFKNESDLENLIVENLIDSYESDIYVSRQQYHGFGRADITINNSLAIELKKGKAKRKDVYQAFEYSFDSSIENTCLLASEFDDSVIEIAKKLNVHCYEYSFAYEDDSFNYPVGFVIEKISNEKDNALDKYLNEMDEIFYISFYDPSFNFGEVYSKKEKEFKQMYESIKELIEAEKKELLENLAEQGYDTSIGFEKLIEQIKQEGVI